MTLAATRQQLRVGIEPPVPGLRMALWTEALSLGSKLFDIARDWFASRIPKRTLVIVPRDFLPPFLGPSFWSVASFPGSPEKREMFVRFTFMLRNVASQPVRVVRSHLKIVPRRVLPGGARIVEGRWMLQPGPDVDVYGDYPVCPEVPAVQAEANWLVEPAVAAEGQSFVAKVCLVDDFGRKHWTKKLIFKPMLSPRPMAPPQGAAR
jgi:hypothetical protein